MHLRQALVLVGVCAASLGAGASANEAPTGDDSLTLVREMQERLETGNLVAVNEFLDTGALVQRVVAGIEISPALLESYVDRLIVSLQREAWFGRDIVNALSSGGSYRVLRTFTERGERRVLVRLLTRDGRVNYHELLLERRIQTGPVRVVDVYSYREGEWLSVLHQGALQRQARREADSAYRRILGEPHQESFDELARLDELSAQGEHRKAFELLRRLPEGLQNEKEVLIKRLAITRELSDAHYLDALARVRSLRPDDTSLDLVCLDAYADTGQYDRALRTLERLEARIVNDAYLRVRRAEIFLARKQYDDARRLVLRAIEEEPLLEAGYRALAAVARETRDGELLERALVGLRKTARDVPDAPRPTDAPDGGTGAHNQPR